MYFNSFLYVFLFLPIVLLLYSLTREHVVSKYIIVIASLIFYGWKQPWFVVPMLATGLVDHHVAHKIADS